MCSWWSRDDAHTALDNAESGHEQGGLEGPALGAWHSRCPAGEGAHLSHRLSKPGGDPLLTRVNCARHLL